jgi:hypothetical protein
MGLIHFSSVQSAIERTFPDSISDSIRPGLNGFWLLTSLNGYPRTSNTGQAMGLEYIMLAPGFVKEVLDACDGWESRDAMPMKLQELMMVLRIEVYRRYK